MCTNAPYTPHRGTRPSGDRLSLNHIKMKIKAILPLLLAFIAMSAKAQTYTQHVQQPRAGEGTVTITQSASIDSLVNGIVKETPKPANPKPSTQKPVTTKPATPAKPSAQKPTPQEESERATREKARELAGDNDRTAEHPKHETDKPAEESHKADTRRNHADEEEEAPAVDMHKKVMRGSKKVTGYRVQAFSGGNTRKDKQRAQQIGEQIKRRFPDQPIYVHFYSPRWICRVGNYRSYGEAQRMLKAVQAMGYRSATIVKGLITVFE